MLSCTPGGRKWKFNPLSINTRYSRLGDSKRNLWAGIFAFVGVVDGAWQHGESYMIGECVKIYKKISQEGHF